MISRDGCVGNDQLGPRAEFDHAVHFAAAEHIAWTYPAYNPPSKLPGDLSDSELSSLLAAGNPLRVDQDDIKVLVFSRRFGAKRIEKLSGAYRTATTRPGSDERFAWTLKIERKMPNWIQGPSSGSSIDSIWTSFPSAGETTVPICSGICREGLRKNQATKSRQNQRRQRERPPEQAKEHGQHKQSHHPSESVPPNRLERMATHRAKQTGRRTRPTSRCLGCDST